jgi:hypothetical protein
VKLKSHGVTMVSAGLVSRFFPKEEGRNSKNFKFDDKISRSLKKLIGYSMTS